MQGLRRAWAWGLPGSWPRWSARALAGAAPRRAALGGPSPCPGAAGPLRRRGAATEEEVFVFPEFLPEGPAATGPPARLRVQEEEAAEAPRARLPSPAQAPRRRKAHEASGRPDPSVPPSGVSCSGCGAELHCREPGLPGYLPSAKYRSLVGRPGAPPGQEGEAGAGPRGGEALEEAVCQRCWFLVHHQQALQVQVTPEEHRRVLSAALQSPLRHGRPPLVLCMVDMLELPDLLLPELAGSPAHVLVLGNKVDLLPGDFPGYLKRLREHLLEACARVGLARASGGPGQRVVDVHLISAKTGYGVEELISKLQRSWKFSGDVYLVGATNAGKSTLFNTLLRSDYCKSRASDVTKRATISPWPGTTLNLLKFPIINPTPFRIFRREERLAADAAKTEEDLNEDERKHLKTLKKQGYVIGRVGRTFQLPQKLQKNYQVEFDAEALSFSAEEEPAFPSQTTTKKAELSYNEVKDARWFHDTPGIIKDGCVLNFLKEKEVKLVLPTCAIVPRTFLLKPGHTLFLGALGRIDYLQGDQSSWFSVVASNLLPVHITMVEKADAIYQKHAGHNLLKVPIGGEERMKDFPPLVPQDVMLEGLGGDEAVADIKLSSAGWVAVTAHSNNKMQLRCYTPKGTMLTIRKPPLLPHIVQVKGERVKRSPAYKTKRPPPLVENLRTNVKK